MGAEKVNVSAALKDHWAKNVAKVLWDDPSVPAFLAMIEKKSGKTHAGGKKFIQPIHYGDGSSISRNFATAQNKATGTTTGSSNLYTAWEVPATTQNAIAVWDREVIDAIQNDAELFDLAEAEMAGKMRAARNRLGIYAPGNGWGGLATISAITTSSITIALDKSNRLAVGDDIQAAQFETTGALRSATSRMVAGVAPSSGVITLDGDPTALGWAVNDTIFFKDDRDNVASPARGVLYGAGGWVPAADPGPGDSWCNVNRQGVWQLAGLRLPVNGLSIKTGLIRGANYLSKFGRTRPTLGICASEDWATLADTLDSVKHVSVNAKDFQIGYEGLIVSGAQGGSFKLVADPYWPKGEVLLGDFDAEDGVYMIYSGDMINVDDHDGNIFLRSPNAPKYECRQYFYGNIVFGAPGKFIRLTGVGL